MVLQDTFSTDPPRETLCQIMQIIRPLPLDKMTWPLQIGTALSLNDLDHEVGIDHISDVRK